MIEIKISCVKCWVTMQRWREFLRCPVCKKTVFVSTVLLEK